MFTILLIIDWESRINLLLETEDSYEYIDPWEIYILLLLQTGRVGKFILIKTDSVIKILRNGVYVLLIIYNGVKNDQW